jgi:DNA-binding CsgD family transcriptional regulator/tetratricopeptide (TPR) repeat protein
MATPSQSARSLATTRAPFIGRQRELALLEDRLVAAGRGEGGVIFVTGEPGIGKSSLLAEFAARARKQGWLVLSGRSYEADAMAPFLPFAEALSEYIADIPDEELGARLGDSAAAVAVLLPQLRERLQVVPRGPRTSTQDRSRPRLLRELSGLFLNAARTCEATGILLTLDDVHWADSDSLALFEYLARDLPGAPMLVVSAYRDTDLDPAGTLAGVVERLTRERILRELNLQRLDEDGVRSLLATLGRPDPPAALVSAVSAETEGNPFFVEEVFRSLTQDGRLFDASGNWQPGITFGETELPRSVRLVIQRRLERLSAECRSVLSRAAVIGRTFDYELLTAIADQTEEALYQALEEAERAHLVAPDEQGLLAFGHELVRQTLLSDLTLPRRQRLHARVADAIEGLHTEDVGSFADSLTEHLRLAGPASDAAKLVGYATLAGDQAAARFAFGEATRRYDLALKTLITRGKARDDARASLVDLQCRRGDALIGLADWEGARKAFEAAIAESDGATRAEALIRLASAFAGPAPPDPPFALRLAEEAAQLAREAGNVELEAAATAIIAQCNQVQGRIKEAMRHYGHAAPHFASLTAPLSGRVHGLYPLVLYWVGRIDEAVAQSREAMAAAQAANEILAAVAYAGNLGLALAASGRFTEALAAFDLGRAAAAAYGPGAGKYLAGTVAKTTVVPMEAYDYERAEAFAEEARDLGRASDSLLTVISEGIDLMNIATVRGDLGRAGELASEVEANLDRGGSTHEILWRMRLADAKAGLALTRGQPREASGFAHDALERAREMGRPKYESRALASRGTALARMGRKKEGLAELRAAVEVARPVGDPSMLLRAASAYLAVEPDEALARDARAVADFILPNLPPEMVAPFQAADPVRLVYALTGAKAEPTAARVEYPDGLTKREVEVLQLLARGNSSREIGEALVLSVRTVERHVANIYLKTDTHGRAQATAYALAKGFV